MPASRKRVYTRKLPGSLSVGNSGGIVRLNPNVTALLGQVVPNATPHNSGVMTAAQAEKLANLTPGGGGAQTFDSFADFPAAADSQGEFAIASDTDLLYCANAGQWWPVALLA